MANQRSSSNPSEASTMVDRLVLDYLQNRGYPGSSGTVVNGLPVRSIQELVQQVIAQNGQFDGLQEQLIRAQSALPSVYEQSYRSLRQWMENSLDWYKPELMTVLYPVFVHTYLELVSKGLPEYAQSFIDTYKSDHLEHHSEDIEKLSTITDPRHVEENELAQMFRNNKYNLPMASVPFELLLNYLQDNKFITLLQIFNQYINIQVVQNQSRRSGVDGQQNEVIGITGHTADQIDQFNRQNVQLGRLRQDASFTAEVEQMLKDEDSKPGADDAGQESLTELYKKIKRESEQDSPSVGDVPLPPHRGTNVQAEVDVLNDVRKRVALGSASLPSICCYTFHNTYDSLNCLSFSHDTTMIAGGFDESYIRIWSLNGERLRGLRGNINPAHVNDLDDLKRQRERHGSLVKQLVGHSGPVYGVTFSHDNKYILSCSEDRTARLWSTTTYSNLVVYKGHNYPVWDVDFGPYGFYFATASHDRTARLWSCDNIHPLRIFAGHLSDVECVKFHPNSKYIVTGSSDRTARLWDIQRGSCVRVFTGHTGGISAVAISPNGRTMASAGEDKSITLWDLGSGKKLKKFTGHTGAIYTLDFSADDNVLVSGSADCTVRVWDVKRDTPYALSVTGAGNDKKSGGAVNGTKSKKEDGKDVTRSESAANSENARKNQKDVAESPDQLGVFPTKRTPIYKVQFTPRNLCLSAGAFLAESN